MRVLYSKDNIEVRQGDGVRSLWLNNACMGQAEASNPNVAVSKYIKEIVAIIKQHKFKRVLVIGGGAMLIPSAIRKDCVVTVVEPNIDIWEVAEQYFKADSNCFWLGSVSDTFFNYDCVVLDAYNDYEPVKELYNEEFYDKFKDSYLIVNDKGSRVWQREPKSMSIK